jgi:hypothetical protein
MWTKVAQVSDVAHGPLVSGTFYSGESNNLDETF